jgi:DNA polymerase-3 subunit alpha
MSEKEFVHFHCHSEFSINTSLIRIPALVEHAEKNQFKSIVITDSFNLFSAVKFYQKSIAKKIKPIFGAELKIKNSEGDIYSLIALCKDHQGYLNLSELISIAYSYEQGIEGIYLNESDIVKHNAGLIFISTAIKSDISRDLVSKNVDDAILKANTWKGLLGDRFYLAVQRTQKENDEFHLSETLKLASKLDIPVIATNDVQFLNKADFEAHEARICIADGMLLDDPRREKRISSEQYYKSAEEMTSLFSDLPQLITNTVELAKRCNVHFSLFEKNYLPIFPIPEGMTISEFFREESSKGLEMRLQGTDLDRDLYFERLNFELDVIIKMDFPGYFLIVSDFIRWSKKNDIPVGPGRGSGAGSLVAYALSITNVDPIKHGLLFERFLNPDRISMPDFDIDFCTDRRDEVIEYVSQKYGREKVSQIITYGTMAAKGVVRDVGRVLGHPYGFSDRIAKAIPNDLKITLDKALLPPNEGGSDELRTRYDSEEAVTTLIDLSKKLEGLTRNVGTHAGGVVIAPSKISDFCPIYKASDTDGIVSQFDKDDVEAVGLVKFDFLGLSNLTVIDKTLKTIKRESLSEEDIDIDKLTLDDPKVYELLQRTDTTGIFQLESAGMRGYLKKLKPDNFEDIVAMLALYRPGPLDAGMVEDYIDVKHGADIKYPHPLLEEILKPTNGVFLYQEQVMKSAQVLAGYTLGGADILRRAMGKKKPEEMAKQRDVFVKGAAEKEIDEKKANEIFDLIDKFSGYGFNKSHSVAYAYISYQTAWLKSHYPAPFMASVLSGMMDDTDRVAFTVSETKKMGLTINKPSIAEGKFEFGILDEKTITYGLGSIKGVGEAFINEIVNERSSHGEFKDLFDFCLRIDKKFLNRRAIEALIYSGAFDIFKHNRATLLETYPIAIKQAEQQQKDQMLGQGGLFSEQKIDSYEAVYRIKNELDFNHKVKLEKGVMGYYFDTYPTDEHINTEKIISAKLLRNQRFRENRDSRVIAYISKLNFRTTNKGDQMVSILIEDKDISINAVVFAKNMDKVREHLNIDEVCLFTGKISKDFRDEWQLTVEDIEPIENEKQKHVKFVEIILNQKHLNRVDQLKEIINKNSGDCPVRFRIVRENAQGLIKLDKEIGFKASKENQLKIDDFLGNSCVNFIYQ